MAGLVPAIHVFLRGLKTWMPGTRACPGLDPGPGMTNEAWSCARLVSQRLGGDKAACSRMSLQPRKVPVHGCRRAGEPRLLTSTRDPSAKLTSTCRFRRYDSRTIEIY